MDWQNAHAGLTEAVAAQLYVASYVVAWTASYGHILNPAPTAKFAKEDRQALLLEGMGL